MIYGQVVFQLLRWEHLDNPKQRFFKYEFIENLYFMYFMSV